MTNDVQKTGPNPWEQYGKAAATRTTVGELLKFTKGDYVAGPYNDEIPIGTKLYAMMDSLNVGWIKWQDNRPAERITGAVGEGFQPPCRTELGDNDKSQWETDDQGHPRDPWQFTNELVLIEVEGGKTYTFTTSSRGGIGAIGELCSAYGKAMRQQPDRVPGIELDVGSYQHSNRAFGRIKFPIFKIVDWANATVAQRLLAGMNEGEGAGDDDLPGLDEPAPSGATAPTSKKKKTEPAF